MGFVDNMVQTESTMVASLSNGSHSEEKLGRLPLENGHCASHAGQPKRRRVSAIRDFPPGCGLFTRRIFQNPNEAGVCVDIVNNSMVQEKNADVNGDDCLAPSVTEPESQSLRVSQSSDPFVQTNHVASSTEEPAVSSNQANGFNSVNAEPVGMPLSEASEALNDAGVVEPRKASETGTVDVSKTLHKVNATAPVGEIVPRKYPPRRRISAIRHFPPLCGRNAPCLSEEECAKLLASMENQSLDLENSGVEEKPVNETVKALVKQVEDDVQDGEAERRILERNLSKPTGDEVRSESEGPATRDTRNEDEFGASSGNEREVEQEDIQAQSIKFPHDSIQYHHDQKSKVVSRSGNGDIEVLKENEGKDSALYLEDIGNLEDKVRPESEEFAAKKIMNQNEFGASSKTKMKVAQEDMQERSIESRQTSIQDHHHQKSKAIPKSCDNLGKDFVYMENKSFKRKLSDLSLCDNKKIEEDVEATLDRVIVLGLMSAQNCPGRQGKGAYKSHQLAGGTGKNNGKKNDSIVLEQPTSAFGIKKTKEVKGLGEMDIKNNVSFSGKACQGLSQMVVCNEKDDSEQGGECADFRLVKRSHNFGVSLPPSCPVHSSGKGDDSDAIVTRSKVRETLRLFQAICRKLLQEEEAKSKEWGNTHRRIDYQAARVLKEGGKYVNTGKQIIGSVPGVEVGDEFQYRVELNIIGLHRQIQGGIDYVKQGDKILATSVVSSGGYDDDTDNSDVLIYTGQGGNVMNGGKEPEHQKLERGNLALKNSMDEQNPVRVIRGDTKLSDSSDARVRTYVYDGLYKVVECWQEFGPHEKLVFKFKLVQIPDEPELAWKVVNKSKKSKVREGLYVDDISQGKEKFPICAVNNIDDEKPPTFEYVTHMIYPDWCHPSLPKGCDCANGCSESLKCSCVAKNGGEIPYNHNGAIVEAKPLVHECGPSCKCPPSCHNRVSQHGIKFQLEIFKTESRGWGVRALNFIPSGSFICEYAGELLEEKEAEERTGNDEYLFDIGNNYNDSSLWDGLSTLMPDSQSGPGEVVQEGGFTIDAAQYGNVGRFVNHSCSPNLYAQNVLYDHEDKRIPHIMLFAAENIPPLQELTYHYNYMMDNVFDSNGNIKKKSCYCGSSDCTGRMY